MIFHIIMLGGQNIKFNYIILKDILELFTIIFEFLNFFFLMVHNFPKIIVFKNKKIVKYFKKKKIDLQTNFNMKIMLSSLDQYFELHK